MIQGAIEILLVEDNPADVELTLRSLRRSKLANNVHVARDGEEALDFLFCRGPHAGRDFSTPKVMLLDLKLPKIDGIEVLQAVRADEQTRLLPVVILTSSREQVDVMRSYKLGVNSYIQKPVDFEQFQATIRQLGLYWLVVNQPPSAQ
ncbi:MAG: response regulator [Terriglobia bacterium]